MTALHFVLQKTFSSEVLIRAPRHTESSDHHRTDSTEHSGLVSQTELNSTESK